MFVCYSKVLTSLLLVLGIFLFLPIAVFALIDDVEILKQAQGVTKEKYPNSDAVILYQCDSSRYDEEGLGEEYWTQYLKILTQKGVDENNIQAQPYDEQFNHSEYVSCEIISEDGSRTEIDIKKQSSLSINSSQMSVNIYDPNMKILSLNVPRLKVNDIIKQKVKFIWPEPYINKVWTYSNSIQSIYPILYKEIIITAPKSLPLANIDLQNSPKNGIFYSKTEENDTLTYKWKLNDIPRFFPEQNMPAILGIPLLFVSTIPNWEFISKWYWSNCESHMNSVNQAMKDKVKELIEGKKNDEEKIKALYYWVAINIRYLQSDHLKNPPFDYVYDASYIFDMQEGVCRNKALLLASMLRLAGFNAYPTLVSAEGRLNSKVPLLYFDHAIVAIEKQTGDYTLLDPTMGDRSKEIYPEWLANDSYLVAKPEGDILRVVDSRSAIDNLTLVNINAELTEAGALDANIEIIPQGVNAANWRLALSSISNSERNSVISEFIIDQIPSTEIKKIEILPRNIMDLSVPLSINVKIIHRSAIINNGSKISFFFIPSFGYSFNYNLYNNQQFNLFQRRFPLIFYSTSGYRESINIKLMGNIKVLELPENKKIESRIFDFVQNSLQTNNEITITRELLNNEMELSPEEYLEVRKRLAETQNLYKQNILLTGIQTNDNDSLSDSQFSERIIEKKNVIELKDSNNWTETLTVKKQLLNHVSLSNNAEIKIPFCPELEDVKLVYGYSLSSNGEKMDVQPGDIQLMDATWNILSPRYPKGKILVVNFPNIDVGSTICYTLQREIKSTPFFSKQVVIAEENPIDKYTLSIEYPKNLTLKMSLANSIGVDTKTQITNTSIIKMWEVNNIPGSKFETNLPPEWVFQPTVFLSTGSWRQYSDSLMQEIKEHSNKQLKTEQLAKKLVNNNQTILEKVKSIRDYVSINIRTSQPYFIDLPLSSLSDADVTLNDSYGNSADVAILLFTMLKSVGVDAELVLLGNYPDIEIINHELIKTPQRNLYNKMLVKIKSVDDDIYLNDTNQYSVLGATNSEYYLGYNLATNEKIKILSAKDKMTKTVSNYNIVLNDDGSADYTVSFLNYGDNFAQSNKKFSQLTPENRRIYFENIYSEISLSATPVGNPITNYDLYPGKTEYFLKIDSYYDRYLEYNSIILPVNFFNVLPVATKSRNFPYYQKSILEFETNVTLKVPDGYKIVLSPQDLKYTLPYDKGEIKITSKVDNNTLSLNAKVKLIPAIYTQSEYEAIYKVHNILISKMVNLILITKD